MSRSRRSEGALVGDRDGSGGTTAPDPAEVDSPPAGTGDAADVGEGDAAAPDTADETRPEGDAATDGDTPTEGGSDADGPDPDGADRRADRLGAIAVAAAVSLPIVIAAIAVRSPRWYPQVDLAQIEMRVRDVFSTDPPAVGLGGRIYGEGTQGSHPGPLSFYLLAPVYRLLGSTSWALQMSAALWNVAALTGTLWATSRRWGLRGVLLVGAALAFLVQLYGTELLVYPWNPFMPVLFWVLFLVCVWGVLCGDLPLLPVAVVAGSVCAQTHISYVGLVGGFAGVVVVALALRYRRADGDERRRLRRWSGGSALLGGVLWLPVALEQATSDPGNAAIIVDSVRHKHDPAIGLAEGWSLLLRHLDVTRLLGEDGTGSPRVGAVLLVAWLATAVVAARRREADLTALHVVAGAAIGLGLVNAANIMGIPWFYLSLWGYGTAALVAVAVVATLGRVAADALATRVDADRRRRLAWVPTAALAAAVAVALVPVLRDAPSTELYEQEASSAEFAGVIGPTVDAIEDGTVPGGRDGTFLVSWTDPVALGGPGLAMVNELDRRGYDAGTERAYVLNVRDHRLVDPGEADAEIHVAFGVAAVDEARADPAAREIARFDRRTDDERESYEQMRDQVVADLEAAGLDDAVPMVDQNMMGLAVRDDLPESVRAPLFFMGRMPQPISVFVRDPGS